MAPEQQKTGKTTPQTDIYSLGLMFYRLFSGVSLTARPPSHYNSALRPDHDRFILKAMEPDPLDRYANAGEMLEALAPLTEIISLEIEQKRRIKVSNEVRKAQDKAADLIENECYEDAMAIFQEMMEKYPGRQDVLNDYSKVAEKIHEKKLLANQEEQYNLDSRDACEMESAGNLEAALRVWEILADLFPQKSQPEQEVQRLRKIVREFNGSDETVDDARNIDQAAILRERVTRYRSMRNKAWDFADNGNHKDALKIIVQLKEEFYDREELLSELEMIEEETFDSMAKEKAVFRKKLVKRLLISGSILSVVIIYIWLVFFTNYIPTFGR